MHSISSRATDQQDLAAAHCTALCAQSKTARSRLVIHSPLVGDINIDCGIYMVVAAYYHIRTRLFVADRQLHLQLECAVHDWSAALGSDCKYRTSTTIWIRPHIQYSPIVFECIVNKKTKQMTTLADVRRFIRDYLKAQQRRYLVRQETYVVRISPFDLLTLNGGPRICSAQWMNWLNWSLTSVLIIARSRWSNWLLLWRI